MSRYPNSEYVLNLSFDDGMALYQKGLESAQNEKLWELWLAQYPNMTKETFVSFEQFKLNSRKGASVKRSDKEIVEDADNILKSMKKRKN